MTGLCETCKWWDRGGYVHDARYACALTYNRYGVPLYPESKVRPSGVSFEDALYTQRNFGCVQHEPIEDAG